MPETIVGIDLGTTNSEVAIVRDGQPHVFPDESGDPILPSFVGLSEDGRLLVGKAARNQWVLAPERTIKSIKRKMGQDVKVKLGDQSYTPQEISAMSSPASCPYLQGGPCRRAGTRRVAAARGQPPLGG